MAEGLCICNRPERLADVICSMRANGIEPKRLRTVQKDRSSDPWLILVEGQARRLALYEDRKPAVYKGRKRRAVFRGNEKDIPSRLTGFGRE